MRLALLIAAIAALVIAAPATGHPRGGGGGWDHGPGFGPGGPGGPGGGPFGADFADDEGYDDYEDYDFEHLEDEGEEDVEEIPYEFGGRIRAVDTEDGVVVVRIDEFGGMKMPRQLRHMPRPTVEFVVDDDTAIERNDADATLDELERGDRVDVTIVAPEYSPPWEVLETPAFIVSAYSPQAFYGFAGRVDSTADGSITVTVRKVTRRARALLEGTDERTFTFLVDDETRGNTTPDDGKLVGIGIAAAKDATLDEVLATPADVVLRRGGGAARLSKVAARKAKKASARKSKKAARR